MMFNDAGWSSDFAGGEFALESLGDLDITMGPGETNTPCNFKPVNVVADAGVYYATIYACHCVDGTSASQQLAIFFASLKDTDKVKLTILSTVNDIPLPMMINLMAALISTKAKLTIQLDHLVFDNLAYFYLIPETVIKGSEGGLYIPPYNTHRAEDASGPARAMSDFFAWIVSEAVDKNALTQEESDTLHKGLPVVVPNDRFEV